MLQRIPLLWKLSVAFIVVILLVDAIDYTLERVESLHANPVLHLVILFLFAVLIGIITAWIMIRLFIQPTIRRLAQGMNELAEKKFDFRLEENEKDEIGMLASSFNIMAMLFSSYQLELKKARDFLNSILESTADIIISVNARGRILTFNSGAEEALGYKRHEVIGQPIEMIFADPREREAAIDRLNYGDNVTNYETRFLTKNGDVRAVLLTLSLRRNPEGTFAGTFGISKDITEAKQMQEQLIQSQRLAAIGEVFIGIQHSLKNMLNTCKGGAYMIRTGLAKDEKEMFTEGWEIVQTGLDRMTEMTQSMLRFVRNLKPEIETVDITGILQDIDIMIRQNSKIQGIDFKVDIPERMPAVPCDQRMIHSAVMDIVSNAVDACLWKEYANGENPKVSLTAYISHGGQNAIIEIKDNGCGMTDEVKENIFTPFYTTKSKTGTGLGLSITSKMIAAHNGRIDVGSQPEKGTVFRIVLPVSAAMKN